MSGTQVGKNDNLSPFPLQTNKKTNKQRLNLGDSGNSRYSYLDFMNSLEALQYLPASQRVKSNCTCGRESHSPKKECPILPVEWKENFSVNITLPRRLRTISLLSLVPSSPSGLSTGACSASELAGTGPVVGGSLQNVQYILYLQLKAGAQQDNRKIPFNILLCKLPKDHLEIIVIYFLVIRK